MTFSHYSPVRSALTLLMAFAFVLAIAVSTAPPVLAHGGVDHGDEKPATTTSIGPRVDSHSDLFELVGIPSARDGGMLTVFLQEFWTNAPPENAQIEMTVGDETIAGTLQNATYTFAAPWVLKPGSYDLTFSVTAGEKSDLLVGRLEIPEPPPPEASHDTIWDHLWPSEWGPAQIPTWLPFSTLALASLLSVVALRLSLPARRLALTLAGIVGLSSVALAASLWSSGTGVNSTPGASAAALLDRPEPAQRLENGAIFMPKPAQRLLGVATIQTAQTETTAKSVRLVGQIIPDPNHSGLVQALLGGRIEPPEGGFPSVGSAVKKGDLLGYLVPRVEVVDQSDIRQTQGDLDRQIELAEAKLRRLEPLKDGVVPESQIIDARIEVEALLKRRATINPVLGEREALLAPADGTLAQVHVSAGQVVEAQTLLFQIIDPDHLMVEALAFDSETAARIEASGKDALATTAEGHKVTLRFAGRAMTLRQQAVPLRFKVSTSDVALSVGEPVTVQASINEILSAVAVPRASVVRASNGQHVVWAHVEAEHFEPRVVQSVPLDSARVGVTAGLKPGSRIVVRGAELINQVR